MGYIKGIDISNNDGSCDFQKIANDGYEYVYLKATEGANFKDKYMDEFYNGCKANGLKCGAYHFLVGTSSPESQALNFYQKIKDYGWDLVPMMDIETNFDGLSDYVIRFIDTFKQLSPLQLGIYSYTGFIDYIGDIADEIKDFPFWEANYNNNPWQLKDNFFTNRIGHQFSETGQVDGVYTNCDVNEFTEGVLLSDITIQGSWSQGQGDKSDRWWYEHNDGSYTSNGWEKINEAWYHFDSDGYMEYDWKSDGGVWYYLGDSSDGVAKIGWQLINKKWYYFNTDCQLQTGWKQINNKWYYFNPDGSMATGWIKDNDKDYLLYSDGSMAHDTVEYGYKFFDDGHAEKMQ